MTTQILITIYLMIGSYLVGKEDYRSEEYPKWFLDVKADAYGNICDTHIMFNTEEEALKVKIGYKFLG